MRPSHADGFSVCPANVLSDVGGVKLGQLPVHMDRLRSALDPAPIDIQSLPRSVVKRMIAPDGRARVIAYPEEITIVKALFDIEGLYVWHCHIVEHEDNEMMRPYVVSE